MKRLIFLSFIFISFGAFAQNELTLEQCYELVNTNYPLAKQNDIFSKKNKLDASVIQKSKLPTLELAGQATYQSEVTHVPIDNPAISIAPPNKDQYKTTLSVNQLIYGGAVNTRLEVQNNELKTQQKQLEVSLYQLKKQVNQLYFSILLMQEKGKLLEANKNMLAAKLKELKAGIEFGVIKSSAINVLKVEVLKIDQRIVEVNQNKKSLMITLSQLIGSDVSATTILKNPAITTKLDEEITRPELALFQLQKQQIETSEQLLTKKNGPKLFGFATGGYGNPGLNMLDNTFQPYYYVGLKFNWNLFDWNITQKQRMSLAVNKEMIDNQQELFKLNTNIELTRQQAEIDKIAELVNSDKTIIELRKKIVASSDSELKNGAITPSAYTTELTHLFEAENNLKTHEIQLLLAKANYKTIKGN